MKLAVWLPQVILALLFIAIGFMKLGQPLSKLSQSMAWIVDFHPMFVRGLGLVELLLGSLLILPRIIRSLPAILSVYSGYAIALIMLGAIFTHAQRKEYSFIVMNSIILLLSLWVAYRINVSSHVISTTAPPKQ